MSDANLKPTVDADDLEEVPVRPRGKRDAVISVRLAPREASALSALASRTGMSVSELTRSILRNAISTQWRLYVWRQSGVVSYPQETGGAFGQTFGPLGVTHGRVRWCAQEQPLTTVG